MGEPAFLVRLQIKSPQARKALEQILEHREEFEIQKPDDGRRPGLLIFELGSPPDEDFLQVQALIDSGAADEVFLTSGLLSQEVLLRAIRTGAKEFLSQPLQTEELQQALDQFKKRREEPRQRGPRRMGQIFHVIGSKGGIGSTTIAVNLAVALAEGKKTHSVALMDMNMPFGEIPLFLEIAPRYHWGEAIKNSARLDESFLTNILVRHSSGVHVLPSPASVDYYDPRTLETLERLLGLLRRMFDIVVLDGGHSLGGMSLRLLELSDQILLVSVLSLPCLTNAQKILNILRDLRHPPGERVRVVVNRYLKNSDITLKVARESIHQDVYWTVPNDYRTTMSAINQGKPIAQLAPRTPIARSLRDLAATLLEQPAHPEKGV
ncbi:MAG: AAA family ATPase [bacterium]